MQDLRTSLRAFGERKDFLVVTIGFPSAAINARNPKSK
jgi:hypothetical protein